MLGSPRPAALLFLSFFASVLFLSGSDLLSGESAEDQQEAEKHFGIESRALWANTRLIGTPDPPPPYHAVQSFTKLKFHQPLYLEAEPGTNNLLLVQQDGKILRFASDAELEQSETLLELEQEPYGLTFHPEYLTNGFIYIVSNGPKKAKSKKDRVSRFTVSREAPFKCDPASEKVIIEWVSNGHNGGDLTFGLDRFLYITAGDGTSDSDPIETGQDLSNLNATLMRIDVDHPDKDRAYSIPKDNPFVLQKDARGEIWAYGFRNPWRIALDHQNGNLWVGNIGQDQWEMIHLVGRGENYGWSVTEGGHPFQLQRGKGPTPIIKPTLEHPHSEARSITGGVVYYGNKHPDLQGAYIYGDYSTGKIWAARHDGTNITFHKEIADTTLQILGFAVDQQGELLICDYGGGVFRLEPTPPQAPMPPFPRRLSETGLFLSVAKNQLQPGVIPYSVNAPLWSDNAIKSRFFALPGEGKIGITDNRGWNFPEGSVLVKTFALEMNQGEPASKRFIETRLLVRYQKEWLGYSYLWNEDQSDALLVEADGADKVFKITDAGNPETVREQTWRYPSRAECMMCHSRAANYVLGLSTLQMNKSHDYGEVVDNQLRTFNHLGLFEKELVKDIDALPRLVSPADDASDLTLRVKAYLQANCAHCHIEAGGGNSLMQLEYVTGLEEMRILDVTPQHQTFNMQDTRIIAPHKPQKSIMLQRISKRGQAQMPPLGSALVDPQAVKLFTTWIEQLSAENKPMPEKKKP